MRTNGFTHVSPEKELEDWRTTVRMLDHLAGMADALMLDPLILALVDAKNRAEEELERARERPRSLPLEHVWTRKPLRKH